jgi:hypothetical protein
MAEGIEDAALEKADIGGAGEESDYHNGMDGMSTGATRDSLETVCDLLLQPARFRRLLFRGSAKPPRDQGSHSCILLTRKHGRPVRVEGISKSKNVYTSCCTAWRGIKEVVIENLQGETVSLVVHRHCQSMH